MAAHDSQDVILSKISPAVQRNGASANTKRTPAKADAQPAPDENFLVTEAADDEGHAQCVNRLYPGQFLHVPAFGWMKRRGNYFTHDDGDAEIDRAIIATLRARRLAAVVANNESVVKATKATRNNKNSSKDLLASIVHRDASEFDSDPDLLNCQNGVLNLRTGQMLTGEQSGQFSYCLPVAYDDRANPDRWLNFLTGAVDDPEHMVPFLQTATGYSLGGRTSGEVFFYVFGPPRGGKGTYTNTLLELLGHPASSIAKSAEFATFTRRRENGDQGFDLAGLKAARFVVASESNANERLNSAKVKQITGGDPVSCAHKHKDFFSYTPQYKIWLVSNNPANASPDDDAVWHRLRLVTFPNDHTHDENPELKNGMTAPDVLASVLAWAVAGAVLWDPAKAFPRVESSRAAAQKQRDSLDHVKQWLEQCTTTGTDDGDWAPNPQIRKSYQAWCEENGCTPLHAVPLTKALTKKGFDTGFLGRLAGDVVARGVKGLKVL